MGPRDAVEARLRSPASIDHLLWVANTRHGPGGHWFARPRVDTGDHDHLADAADAVDYLARHRVDVPRGRPTASQLERLRVVREAVRGLLDPSAPDWTPDAERLVSTCRFRVTGDGGILAAASGWSGFVSNLVPPLVELVGRRDRLRVCGNPRCRLVFLDLSRNASRRWCDSSGCGNRDRVRRHRLTAASVARSA